MGNPEKLQGIKVESIKPRVGRDVFLDGDGFFVLTSGRLLNLGCATGRASFARSASSTGELLRGGCQGIFFYFHEGVINFFGAMKDAQSLPQGPVPKGGKGDPADGAARK